jgi:dihydroneopterin aldolase
VSDEVTIVLQGLEVWGHCGVTAAERADHQRLVIDVELVPSAVPGATSDELAGTLDYARAAEIVVAAVAAGEYALLERLATEILDRLFAVCALARARVAVAKPAPPGMPPLAAARVEVVRRA